MAFPGGESKEECAVRNLEGFQRVVTVCIREQISEAALVVHGGTIMAALERFASPRRAYFDWHAKPGGGFVLDGDPWTGNRTLRVLKEVNITNGD